MADHYAGTDRQPAKANAQARRRGVATDALARRRPCTVDLPRPDLIHAAIRRSAPSGSSGRAAWHVRRAGATGDTKRAPLPRTKLRAAAVPSEPLNSAREFVTRPLQFGSDHRQSPI